MSDQRSPEAAYGADSDESPVGGQHALPESMVSDVIETRTHQRGACGICGSSFAAAISTLHDRECSGCGTAYWITGRDEDGQPKHEVDMSTTPVRRIEKKLRQRAHEAAALDALGGDSGAE